MSLMVVGVDGGGSKTRVMVADENGREVVSNAHAATRTRPLLVSGAQLHVLPAGSKFDLKSRALIPTPAQPDPAEVEELEVAADGLRRLARDIAAEGVSPTNFRRRRARSTSADREDGSP